jgi:hypothetical protein
MNTLSLQDERDIAAVLTSYITGIDTKNADLVRDAFAENIEADYAPTMKFSTGAEVARVMDKVHQAVGPTLHRLTNIAITPTREGAAVRTYVDAIIMSIDGTQTLVEAAGYYDDYLVKINGAWKIKTRRLSIVRLVGQMPITSY